MHERVLTINGGSSTLKFAVFSTGDPPQRGLAGSIDRIGSAGSRLRAREAGSAAPVEQQVEAADLRAAAGLLLDWLGARDALDGLAAVGHRVVHGGERLGGAERVTPELIEDLRALGPLDPDHMPGGIALLDAFLRRLPGVPQVACFDTSFHRRMPDVARRLPIPRRYADKGVRRYGFHGLSYAYLLEELGRVAGPEAAHGRLVLAHLGSGASLAAVSGGECQDTTMALTPASGLMMGTRSGDLDPGVLVHLMRTEDLSVDAVDGLVNRASGLLGVSETSADMRDLLACAARDPRAAEAIALFCYTVKKGIGAYAAALGGIDTLVFSGGIGENAPEVRGRACDGLGLLGIRVDEVRNRAGAPVISPDGTPVTVRVIATDEESMIAREVGRVLRPA